MSASQLTQEEWQFLSILVAQDVNRDVTRGLITTARQHHRIWQKIQDECEWPDERPEGPVI